METVLPDMTKLEFVAPPVLERLNLSGSLSVEFEGLVTITVILHKTKNLRYLDYSRNGLHVLGHSFHFTDASQHLITLDLSYNDISSIIGGVANREDTIGALNLRGNRLGQLVMKNTFTNFVNLTSLHLSDNVITFLTGDEFEKNNYLEVIDLGGNALRDIPDGLFNKLYHLRMVDLSSNVISQLRPTTTTELEDIANKIIELDKGGRTLNVSLIGNPLECKCETREFLKWTNKHRAFTKGIRLLQVESYSCWYQGELLTWEHSELDAIISRLDLECTLKLAVAISLPCAFVLALIVACAVWCKRHKWDIKFWFLNTMSKRKQMREEETERRSQFKHDAFVAYHVNDVMWVKNTLLPKIEGGGGGTGIRFVNNTVNSGLGRTLRKTFFKASSIAARLSCCSLDISSRATGATLKRRWPGFRA